MWVLAHDVLVRNKRGHRGDERTHAAQIGANDQIAPLVTEAGKQNRGGHIADDLAGRHRHFQRMAADQRARQLVELGHAFHVADEDEEHAEGERQSPVHVLEHLAVADQERGEHDHAHGPQGDEVTDGEQTDDEQQRVDDGAPAAIARAVAGDTDLVGLVLAAFRREHALFDAGAVERLEFGHRLFAEHDAADDDQHHRRGRRIRCHDADHLRRRHAGERLQIQVVRVADRREHTAHVGADGHQRADEHSLILHVRHDEHGDRERDERDERHVVGDEHRGEVRHGDQRDHQSARGVDVMQQPRADDAEHADALEAADDEHQAAQLADRAHVHVVLVAGVGRDDEAGDQREYGGDYQDRFAFKQLDQPSSHGFLREFTFR